MPWNLAYFVAQLDVALKSALHASIRGARAPQCPELKFGETLWQFNPSAVSLSSGTLKLKPPGAPPPAARIQAHLHTPQAFHILDETLENSAR